MHFMIARAVRTAPEKPRTWCRRTSYGFMLASSASRLMAQAISACFSQRFMSYRWMALMAVSRFEPLIAASPSRACRSGMGMPARSIASRPGRRSPW